MEIFHDGQTDIEKVPNIQVNERLRGEIENETKRNVIEVKSIVKKENEDTQENTLSE